MNIDVNQHRFAYTIITQTIQSTYTYTNNYTYTTIYNHEPLIYLYNMCINKHHACEHTQIYAKSTYKYTHLHTNQHCLYTQIHI